MRYAQIALTNWETLDGFAVSQGMGDLRELPVNRFNNFIWWWATRNAGEASEVERFRAQLWRPPAGVTEHHPDSPWSPEAEADAFEALRTQLNA